LKNGQRFPLSPEGQIFFVSIYVFNAYFGTENRVLEVRSTKTAKTAKTALKNRCRMAI
jgi:hypothetical protein